MALSGPCMASLPMIFRRSPSGMIPVTKKVVCAPLRVQIRYRALEKLYRPDPLPVCAMPRVKRHHGSADPIGPYDVFEKNGGLATS